jgi:hypothetical protein
MKQSARVAAVPYIGAFTLTPKRVLTFWLLGAIQVAKAKVLRDVQM